MSFFSRLFGASDQPAPQRPLVCSGCYTVCSGKDAHVIPWWNPSNENFNTTYRCSKCWLIALDETDSRINNLDPSSREKFSEFLDRHNEPRLSQDVRAATVNDASTLIAKFLSDIRSQKIMLNP